MKAGENFFHIYRNKFSFIGFAHGGFKHSLVCRILHQKIRFVFVLIGMSIGDGLDRDGNIVTQDGEALEPQITIPAEAQGVTIGSDGTVSFSLPGQTATQIAGQIQIANFPNPAGLNSIGRNLYMPTDASGEAQIGIPGGQEGMGALLQGYVEQSNVSVVSEFINLIVAQRAYEANSKIVRAADEMYQQANNVTR